MKNRILQIFLVCLTAICTLLALGSLLAISVAGEVGMYEADTQEDYEEILSEQQNNLEKVYAIAMIAALESDEPENDKLMDGSNMNYMIVRAESKESPEQIIYTSKNAQKNSTEFRQNAYCMEIYSPQPNIPNYKNIFSVLWRSRNLTLSHFDPENYSSTVYNSIDDVYYVKDTGCFYYVSYAIEGVIEHLFPIQQISLSESKDKEYQWNGSKYISTSSGQELLPAENFTVEWSNLWLDNFWYEPSEIKITDTNSMQNCVIHQDYQLSAADLYHKEERITPLETEISYVENTNPEKDIVKYLVYADLEENLQPNELDYFYEQQMLYQTLFQYRYQCIWAMAIAIILGFASIVLYVYSIMRQKQRQTTLLRKIPLLIPLALSGLVTSLNGFAIVICSEALFSLSNGMIPICLAGIIICLIAEVILCMLFIGECTARIRDKVFLKNTICYHLLHLCKKYLKICWKCIKKGLEMIPMYPKTILTFLALSILELFVIGVTDYEVGLEIFLFLVFKLIETPLLFLLTLHVHRLQNAAKQMAEGDLGHHINTDRMLSFCKQHGNYLNQIADGMNLAIEERLKSERFRTELITNVSHDIKTPLTSIVNYVDLLQKEGISNEEREEYIEVLDRQSARLKKLIDDLMDASKASTGNVEVNLEKCDVGIMMVQTLGEYEEKMAALDLHLITAEASDNLLVQADSRHLWRVFDNLLNNICKYSQPGTRVYVNQETDEREVKIIFRNTSKYPLNLNSEDLLERFTRGDSSRHTEGSGLGLAIAKNLTELMHGEFLLTTDGDLFKVVITLQTMA